MRELFYYHEEKNAPPIMGSIWWALGESGAAYTETATGFSKDLRSRSGCRANPASLKDYFWSNRICAANRDTMEGIAQKLRKLFIYSPILYEVAGCRLLWAAVEDWARRIWWNGGNCLGMAKRWRFFMQGTFSNRSRGAKSNGSGKKMGANEAYSSTQMESLYRSL